MTKNEKVVTLGAGCFWCVEAVLEQVDGVLSVESGYMGGEVERPSYEQVCSGATGHAEVVRVTFDADKLGLDELLGWFWQLHDPTTLNRQGADVGTQYRSAIFLHTEEDRAVAEQSMAAGAGGVSGPDRHGDHAGQRVLARGGLSPGLLPGEQVQRILPRRHRAQAAEAPAGELRSPCRGRVG
jgi:methionine-S-sulfoxide reductase